MNNTSLKFFCGCITELLKALCHDIRCNCYLMSSLVQKSSTVPYEDFVEVEWRSS